MAFKLPGFPIHQTMASAGGVTPFKHGSPGPPDHFDPGDGWAYDENYWDSHYQMYHGGDSGDSGDSDYDPNTDPMMDDMYDPENPIGGMDFGLTFGSSGIIPRISGEGAKQIADWGKEKWDSMGTGGKILSVVGGVAAPIAGVAAYSAYCENNPDADMCGGN